MKTLMRKYARFVSNVTKRFACDTFGDTASLHAGPCERCVGHAIEGVEITYTVSGDPSPNQMTSS